MVGIRSFPFGARPFFRGYVSFREGKCFLLWDVRCMALFQLGTWLPIHGFKLKKEINLWITQPNRSPAFGFFWVGCCFCYLILDLCWCLIFKCGNVVCFFVGCSWFQLLVQLAKCRVQLGFCSSRSSLPWGLPPIYIAGRSVV